MRIGHFTRTLGLGALGVILAAGLLVGGPATPSDATGNRGWSVGPSSFGIMYGATDVAAFGAVRAWEAATWCRVQPAPDADMQVQLAASLGPQLDAQRAAGATAAMVGLGHPPAWVFGDDPRATRDVVQYGCSANAAAGVAIPAYATLKRAKNGALPLQAQRWNAYVGAVIDFLNARYGQSMTILLQVWNEPNLSSGLSVTTKVPGASRSVKDAVNALYELERITRDAVNARGNPAITLTSTAMFQRYNDFFRLYLAKHARKPLVSSMAFNVYGAPAKTPDAMVREWNKRVAKVRAQVNRHSKLRRLPAIISETTLNLINNGHTTTNLRASVTDAAAQRRMATAVQMDAFYYGFRSVYWLAGPQVQAAVNVGHGEGTAARSALAVLRAQLIGLRIDGCRTKSGNRTCTFRDPAGARRTARVYWRTSGRGRLSLGQASTIVQMTGESAPAGRGARVAVGTTPIVVIPA